MGGLPEGYMPAPPQDASGHTWHHPDAQLLEITRHGMERLVGNGYRSRMQGYAGVLSEQEMLEVLAFIKSRWPADIIARHNQINSQDEKQEDCSLQNSSSTCRGKWGTVRRVFSNDHNFFSDSLRTIIFHHTKIWFNCHNIYCTYLANFCSL